MPGTLADRSLFDAAVSVLGPHGMCLLVIARLGDRVIGTRFVLLHKGRMIDWYAGSDRSFAAFSPNEVLVWHVLRWGREQGFDLFDFGGAGDPTSTTARASSRRSSEVSSSTSDGTSSCTRRCASG